MNTKLPETVKDAIWQTIAYSDVFNDPLKLEEIHRYLIGFDATMSSVERILREELIPQGCVETSDDYYFLPGKKDLVARRLQRARLADVHWKQAVRYGRWIAHIPFVRMVAITGALANENVEEEADLDYFIVTQPGYLWLCRAMVLILVHLTSPFGARMCPNYLITMNALKLADGNLFVAQELSRMIPLSGRIIYERIRQLNDWSLQYLPNAAAIPREDMIHEPTGNPLKVFGEFLLAGRFGRWLEEWEMTRKISKLSQQAHGLEETIFTADQCKGHFDQHGNRTLNAFVTKIKQPIR